MLQWPRSPRSHPKSSRFNNSASNRSVLARRCSRDSATLEGWITCASSHAPEASAPTRSRRDRLRRPAHPARSCGRPRSPRPTSDTAAKQFFWTRFQLLARLAFNLRDHAANHGDERRDGLASAMSIRFCRWNRCKLRIPRPHVGRNFRSARRGCDATCHASLAGSPPCQGRITFCWRSP
jgi:hypothetical protein